MLFRPFEAQFYIKTVRPGSEILIVNDGGLSVSLTSRAHRGNEKQLPHFKDGGAGPWGRGAEIQAEIKRCHSEIWRGFSHE